VPHFGLPFIVGGRTFKSCVKYESADQRQSYWL